MSVRSRLLLVVALFALLTGSAVHAQLTPIPPPPYSAGGVGETAAEACDAATQAVVAHCFLHGPISVGPAICRPIFDPNLEIIGRICTCTATTSFCRTFPHL